MIHANDRGGPQGSVLRTGKFFEVGREFVDRSGVRFGISAAEADERIARFRPRPINLQHVPTIFDGLLGTVMRLWRDGADICAEFEMPRWLCELTDGRELKISSEWDLATKDPVGAALVLEPALHDAVIAAAFAAYSHGETALGRQAATEEADETDMSEPNLIGKLRALLAKAGAVDTVEGDGQFSAPPLSALEAAHAETARLSAQLTTARHAEASDFAERMVRDLRAVPAERAALVAAYARAAEDDALHGGRAEFAADAGAEQTAMSRVETLKALYAARPPHALTAELLRDTLAVALANSRELTALFAQQTTPDPARSAPLGESRRRELHEMTALGHSALRNGA